MGRKNYKKGPVATAAKPSLEEAIQKGVAAVESGKRDEAHRIFQETAELHPNVVDVWVWLGGTSKNLDEAEEAFERAYSIDPENEKASLGLRWVRLRRTTAAVPISGAAVPVPIYATDTVSDMDVAEPPYTQAAQPVMSDITETTTTGSLMGKCLNCGTRNRATDAVCVHCGQELNPAEAELPGGAQIYISPTPPRAGMSRITVVAIAVAALVVIALIVYWSLLAH